MATAPTRGKPTQTVSPLTLLLWQETLLSWGIPLFLIGVIAVVALLGAFGQIAQPTGVAILGCLLLLLVGFSLFRTVLTGTVEPRLKALTWGLGFAWIAITWAQLYFAVFVGQEMVSGFVSADGGGIVLQLGAQGTVYDLVVEGSFTTAAGEVGREAGYRLLLEKDGQKVQELDGVFSEHWARQRLGRRGSTTSRRLHNHVLHRLLSPGEGPYRSSTHAHATRHPLPRHLSSKDLLAAERAVVDRRVRGGTAARGEGSPVGAGNRLGPRLCPHLPQPRRAAARVPGRGRRGYDCRNRRSARRLALSLDC